MVAIPASLIHCSSPLSRLVNTHSDMSSGNSCITYRNAPEDPCNVTFITKYGSCVSHFKHFLLALSSKSVGEISQIQRSHQALKDNPPVKSASWSQWKPGGVEARLSACSCMYDWKTGACTRKEAEATFKAALLCDYQQAMADDE